MANKAQRQSPNQGLRSDGASFWCERYHLEGDIWGVLASSTASFASARLRTRGITAGNVLDIGCGYGRDLRHLARSGHRVAGIDLSPTAIARARIALHEAGVAAELMTGRFERHDFAMRRFEAVVSHRVLHLLLNEESVERFVDRARRLVSPGGLLCVGVRNTNDIDQTHMVECESGVFEYADRPGHRMRHWDQRAFERHFGGQFELESLHQVVEAESRDRPVPCHVTIMVAHKRTS